MSEPLFGITDVQAISGEAFVEPEITQVTRFIAIASAKIRNAVPGIDARIAENQLDPVLVQSAGSTAVLRALAVVRRGIGVTRTEYPEISTQWATGDTDGGLVYLTDEDLADLVDTPSNGGDSFSISLIGPR